MLLCSEIIHDFSSIPHFTSTSAPVIIDITAVTAVAAVAAATAVTETLQSLSSLPSLLENLDQKLFYFLNNQKIFFPILFHLKIIPIFGVMVLNREGETAAHPYFNRTR